MRKICVITGTRAEYGIMSSLMRKINDCADTELQIIATNMHLSPEFGLTYKEIESDGFFINKKVEMLLSSDTANGTVKSMGLEAIGIADALEELLPDLIVILGDRYEMLVAAQCALIYKIPVAHLYGGETTEGAYDDAIRHAITKLSHLHFTSTEEYRKRVIQMGENPEKVFHVGALGVENILNEKFMSKKKLEESIDFELGEKYFLVTFHPVTLENNTASEQCISLLKALEDHINEYKVIFTLPNSDTDGRVIISLIEEFTKKHPKESFAITSLGRKRYYSAIKNACAVIGNSSSGLVEAPCFNVPTVNIGDRQKGRTSGKTVINAKANYKSISEAINLATDNNFRESIKGSINPYYREGTLNTIFETISACPLEDIIKKSFYNINFED
ncbi:MAG: UDP-N-acetylglucosamine 2-epimerase [Bacteroidales bacterium]|nr:UDP-N-acetylglucosamine 2-epimerase [Bacteroidales bacterium]